MDFNQIDPFHLEARRQTAVNYNRDIEIFPVLKSILKKISGTNPIYTSPTDMGVNKVGSAIIDDQVVQDAAKQELIRRFFRYNCEYAMGFMDKETPQRVELLMNELDVKTEDRKVVALARLAASEAQNGNRGNECIFCGAAIELPDGVIQPVVVGPSTPTPVFPPTPTPQPTQPVIVRPSTPTPVFPTPTPTPTPTPQPVQPQESAEDKARRESMQWLLDSLKKENPALLIESRRATQELATRQQQERSALEQRLMQEGVDPGRARIESQMLRDKQESELNDLAAQFGVAGMKERTGIAGTLAAQGLAGQQFELERNKYKDNADWKAYASGIQV